VIGTLLGTRSVKPEPTKRRRTEKAVQHPDAVHRDRCGSFVIERSADTVEDDIDAFAASDSEDLVCDYPRTTHQRD
jgi:hypothetical protein